MYFDIKNKFKQQLRMQWKLENIINLHCCIFKICIRTISFYFQLKAQNFKFFTKSLWNEVQSKKEYREEW